MAKGIMYQILRRRLFTAAAWLLLVALLTACGEAAATPTVIQPTAPAATATTAPTQAQPTSTTAPTATVAAPTSTTAAATATTSTTAEQTERVITHAFGETTVPANPQRILAIGEDGLLADLISIDAPVVAATVNIVESVKGIDPADLEGILLVSSSGDTSLEALVELQPDLIIGTQYFVEAIGYETLSQIAPTVALSAEDPLTAHVETLAIFGREAEAEEAVAEIQQRVEEEGEALNASERTVSIATIYPGASLAAWVGGPTLIPQVIEDLGFTIRPGVADTGELSVRAGRAFISLEQMTLFDGETLIMLQSDAVEGEQESVTEVEANPLWQTIPAVAAGRVVTIDRLGYPGFSGYVSLLDDLVEALAVP